MIFVDICFWIVNGDEVIFVVGIICSEIMFILNELFNVFRGDF